MISKHTYKKLDHFSLYYLKIYLKVQTPTFKAKHLKIITAEARQSTSNLGCELVNYPFLIEVSFSQSLPIFH